MPCNQGMRRDDKPILICHSDSHPQMEHPSLKTTSVYELAHHITRFQQRNTVIDAKLTEVTLSQATHFSSLKEREKEQTELGSL